MSTFQEKLARANYPPTVDPILRKDCNKLQCQAVQWMLDTLGNYGRFINADDPGMGKTRPCLKVCDKLLRDFPGCDALIVCPEPSVWRNECRKIGIKCHVYHGPNRHHVYHNMKGIIITTYALVIKDEPMFDRRFKIVILDEGHLVKNKGSQRSSKCRRIKTDYKGVVTGTICTNGMDDMCGIMMFFGMVKNKKEFDKRYPKTKEGMQQLANTLLPFWLRRLKICLGLPPKNEYIVNVDMKPRERQFYNVLCEHDKKRAVVLYRKFLMHRGRGEHDLASKFRQNILALILRRRQACVDMSMTIEAMGKLNDCTTVDESIQSLQNDSLANVCKMCLENKADSKNVCGHVFCRRCWKGLSCCPTCKADVGDVEEVGRKKKLKRYIGCKMEDMMIRMRADIRRGKKVIITSQWLRVLDTAGLLIARDSMLSQLGVIKIMGGQTRNVREQIIEEFQTDPDVRILLLSLMAGNASITLTAATSMYIMDEWWNEGIMKQVMDRIHRIGQTEAVNIYRYICKDSIEENIHKLIEKKAVECALLSGEEQWKESNHAKLSQMIKLLGDK